ncbi:putative large tegument protein [Pseudomonas phage Ep4]|uniref:Large tegument protein n=1 Tax=Pseudomonas phage Ep4 TaxID=3057492 RepID=A0AAU9EC89_9CAUD|nr:putative large tegument protein [Pseudomonas phage Ep4]
MSVLNLNALIDEAIELQSVDMSQESTGGAALMPAGYAMARMVTYIELGSQPQEFNGKAKAPASEFKVGFKLYGGPDNCYDGRFISTFDLALSNNIKSGAKKLFSKLNWEGNMKHIAQALGKGFLVPITVAVNATTKKESNRLNIDGILPPIDPVSKSMYPIPEITDADLSYFFFNKPTAETWAALFVEGKWDDGKSKNRTQEKIMSALDFPGSALEQLISGVVLPDLAPVQPTPEAVMVVTPEVVVAPTVTANPVLPVMPSLPVMPE